MFVLFFSKAQWTICKISFRILLETPGFAEETFRIRLVD